MERLSAKESLLLAVSLSPAPCSRNEWPWPAPYWSIRTFRDSGGFDSFVGGKTTEMQKIDIDERIVGLERLNPTPRPTTMVKEYFKFLNKYLATFDGSTDEADAIGAAKEEAAAAIIEFVKSADLYRVSSLQKLQGFCTGEVQSQV
ncbi:hypothetical protein ZWY2020_013967 [Hordeum vulgare]|nr:hypothetical protein ZWY2020_013967 [Hordeum vulgare]